jgi:hypothetical protein
MRRYARGTFSYLWKIETLSDFTQFHPRSCGDLFERERERKKKKNVV